MKAIIGWGIGLIIGGACLFVGIGGSAGDSRVMCGQESMTHGDICEVKTVGGTEHVTFDQMREREGKADSVGRWVALGLGVVLVPGSIIGIIRQIRRRRTAHGATAHGSGTRPFVAQQPAHPYGPPQQPPGGYGPPQYQPQPPGNYQPGPQQQPPSPRFGTGHQGFGPHQPFGPG